MKFETFPGSGILGDISESVLGLEDPGLVVELDLAEGFLSLV